MCQVEVNSCQVGLWSATPAHTMGVGGGTKPRPCRMVKKSRGAKFVCLVAKQKRFFSQINNISKNHFALQLKSPKLPR